MPNVKERLQAAAGSRITERLLQLVQLVRYTRTEDLANPELTRLGAQATPTSAQQAGEQRKTLRYLQAPAAGAVTRY